MLDKDVNQILLLKLRSEIITPLNDIVEWDRYGIRGDNTGYIFGWIKRDDTFYDFVTFNFQLIGTTFFFSYTTSSKKYSEYLAKKLSKNGLNGLEKGHLECKPASDIPEANLVGWQKKIGMFLVLSVVGMLFNNIMVGALLGGGNFTGTGHGKGGAGRFSLLSLPTTSQINFLRGLYQGFLGPNSAPTVMSKLFSPNINPQLM